MSEIKSADWQPLNRPLGESVTNTYMWIGPADKEKMLFVDAFINKESIINHNSSLNSSTYIVNLTKKFLDLDLQEKEWLYKFPRNTKSLKYTLSYSCSTLIGIEGDVWAYSETMAKGKATKVHSGDNEDEDSPNFFEPIDNLNIVGTTCELINKLNVPLSEDKKINTSKQKNEDNPSVISPNFWELYGVLIIHFALISILFVTFQNVGILSTVGSLLKSTFLSFFFFILWVASFYLLSVYILEDFFGMNVKTSTWVGLTYLIIGAAIFNVWAGDVYEKEYLRSPRGQYQQLYKILIDIAGISDRVARTILDQYPSIDKLYGVSIEKICEIPGVGKNLATAIKARLNNLSN